MTNIAGKEVGTADLVVMGAGVVMLLDSFLPWYGVNLGIYGSVHVSGWHSHGWAVLAILLVLIAAGATAAKVFAGQALPAMGKVGPSLAVLGVSGLATVFALLRFLTASSATRFGLYLGIVAAGVQAYFAFVAFRASGETIPDIGSLTGGQAQPPAGFGTGGAPPAGYGQAPPAGGYGQTPGTAPQGGYGSAQPPAGSWSPTLPAQEPTPPTGEPGQP